LGILLFIPAIALGNSASDLSEDLLAYFPFNGNAIDESGNGNDGLVVGAELTTDMNGVPVSAYAFDGTGNTYIDIGTELKVPFPITVAAWIQPNDNSQGVIFRNDRVDGWNWYHGVQVKVLDGKLDGFVGSGYAAPGSRKEKWTIEAPVIAEQWNHVAVVFRDYNDISLFVNGVEYEGEYFGDGTGMTYSTEYIGYIGRGAEQALSANDFDGDIDEVRFYGRELSASEIQELSGQTDPGDIIAYFPIDGDFNDASGNGVNWATIGNVSLGEDRFGNPNGAAVFGGGWADLGSHLIPFGPMSVSLWIKGNNDGGSGYIASNGGESGARNGFYLLSRNADLTFSIKNENGSGRWVEHAWPTGWNHIVATYDGTFSPNSSKLYFNGELVSEDSYSTTNGASQINNLLIGANSTNPGDGESFQGLMDEIRLYNRELSASEIQELSGQFDPGSFSNVALLSIGASAYDNGSFDDYGPDQDAMNAIDGDPVTYWAGLEANSPQSMTIGFDQPYEINQVRIQENNSSSYFTDADFEYYDGNNWALLINATKSEPHFDTIFPTVIADSVRIKIHDLVAPTSWYNQVACIHAFEVNGAPVSQLYDNIALSQRLASAYDNGSFDDYGPDQDAMNAIDGNPGTYWAGLESSSPQMMTIGFYRSALINRIQIQENYSGGVSYFTNADFEYFDGNNWNLLFNMNKSEPNMDHSFSPVLADSVRIVIYDLVAPGSWYNQVACISEFEVYSNYLSDVEVSPAPRMILSNFPNPFNPVTTIKFNVEQGSKSELTVFDVRGRKVKTLHQGYLDAGVHSFQWNGKDNKHRNVSSGVYFCVVKIGTQVMTQKMTLLE
jgi:uncharacterized protein YneR